jgi:hypothetical protein
MNWEGTEEAAKHDIVENKVTYWSIKVSEMLWRKTSYRTNRSCSWKEEEIVPPRTEKKKGLACSHLLGNEKKQGKCVIKGQKGHYFLMVA